MGSLATPSSDSDYKTSLRPRLAPVIVRDDNINAYRRQAASCRACWVVGVDEQRFSMSRNWSERIAHGVYAQAEILGLWATAT
jgi:hypothetical protein